MATHPVVRANRIRVAFEFFQTADGYDVRRALDVAGVRYHAVQRFARFRWHDAQGFFERFGFVRAVQRAVSVFVAHGVGIAPLADDVGWQGAAVQKRVLHIVQAVGVGQFQ